MNYEFKVGDKGKTKDGSDYEVIAEDVRLRMYPLVTLISPQERYPYLATYDKNGKNINWDRGNSNLLPPKRTLTFYFNVYKFGAYSYKSLSEAEENGSEGALLIGKRVDFEV